MLNFEGNVIKRKAIVKIIAKTLVKKFQMKNVTLDMIVNINLIENGNWIKLRLNKNPQGIFSLDLKSEINQMLLKDGPPICPKKL